ncbi:MAG TPA: chemotaxis response regulator protein-glutamate methylesterase [Bryobacteraceae bacterium]|nr:chemotaxis response regulator protein-glutamate methylesterase [Bryobacteraceae bacterium]
MSQQRIRVLIVDDSAIVRSILSDVLASCPDIDVVGTAPDPIVAHERIAQCRPDVITLDLDMPRMDGITFLKTLRSETAVSVVVVTALNRTDDTASLRAMQAGAAEVVPKPGGPFSVADLRSVLPKKVRAAWEIKHRKPNLLAPAPAAAPKLPAIAMGASTGGTEALYTVLTEMPALSPPILVVQHIPAIFSRTFAERLNAACKIRVFEAEDGRRVEPGTALIAPGDRHMSVYRSGGVLKVAITSEAPVCHQRPSVDVLFRSMASVFGPQAIGVLLTGMGADGAAGLLAMRQAGATTIAQDESTCVVYGMPREAVRMGAVQSVLPLKNIVGAMCAAVNQVPSNSA